MRPDSRARVGFRSRRLAEIARVISSLAIAVATLAATVPARAEVECPPGSRQKSSGASTWCEPSVCASDVQCAPGEVCKPVPLCVEIGAAKGAPGLADAGALLMARQKCGLEKKCPQATTCQEHPVCVARAEAEKMGLLGAVPSASPAGSASASAPSAKKSCGCRVVGADKSVHYALICSVGAFLL